MDSYDKGFTTDAITQPNIIGELDSEIIQIIKSQLKENDCFINTTWIRYEPELVDIVNKGKRLVCYSGADWNNKHFEIQDENERVLDFKRIWKYIQRSNCEVIHVGNTKGDYYFSFWLEFISRHLDNYKTFNTWNIDTPLKTYMCLNRKPHTHRKELYNDRENINLLDCVYVNLGGENPIYLENDIVNIEGNQAVNGDVGITNDIHSLGHEQNWNNHFLNVVTETTTYTDVFITEKTFKPIIGERPFVILGDNNIYKQLKEWGFDTFDDLFGTGYEDPDYQKRISWISEIIALYKGDQHLHLLLEDIKPRLQYNSNQLNTAIEMNRKALKSLRM